MLVFVFDLLNAVSLFLQDEAAVDQVIGEEAESSKISFAHFFGHFCYFFAFFLGQIKL